MKKFIIFIVFFLSTALISQVLVFAGPAGTNWLASEEGGGTNTTSTTTNATTTTTTVTTTSNNFTNIYYTGIDVDIRNSGGYYAVGNDDFCDGYPAHAQLYMDLDEGYAIDISESENIYFNVSCSNYSFSNIYKIDHVIENSANPFMSYFSVSDFIDADNSNQIYLVNWNVDEGDHVTKGAYLGYLKLNGSVRALYSPVTGTIKWLDDPVPSYLDWNNSEDLQEISSYRLLSNFNIISIEKDEIEKGIYYLEDIENVWVNYDSMVEFTSQYVYGLNDVSDDYVVFHDVPVTIDDSNMDFNMDGWSTYESLGAMFYIFSQFNAIDYGFYGLFIVFMNQEEATAYFSSSEPLRVGEEGVLGTDNINSAGSLLFVRIDPSPDVTIIVYEEYSDYIEGAIVVRL
ncbi:MAG: hypothetical protein RBQ97_09005 [Acholeplasma sp.]|nr:hypothetical protein [Acholeplasma sp.]